jgi:hypothetical protein
MITAILMAKGSDGIQIQWFTNGMQILGQTSDHEFPRWTLRKYLGYKTKRA